MLPPRAEYEKEIESLWTSRYLSNGGEKHAALEQGLRKYLDIRHTALFCNGHMALEALLESLPNKGGGIITTPFTFLSTTNAIVRKGFRPVFCDVDPDDCTMDACLLEGLIGKDTVAILPVHVYGHVCDVETIGDVAERYKLRLFYDAAHAFGVRYRERGIASYGDACILSMHATKVFHTAEGGLACCRDRALHDLLIRMRNYGILDAEHADYVGGNAKLSELQAAMGLCNLRHIDEEIESRKRLVERYQGNLGGLSGIAFLKRRASRHNYSYLPIRVQAGVDARDSLHDYLHDQGILARKYFYPLTGSFACHRNEPWGDERKTPQASRLSREVLTLPLYGTLTVEDVDYICASIRDWKGKSKKA